MADAYVIESAGVTAGIVVAEKRGLRFYASDAAFHPLDGKSFTTVSAAHRAVRQLQNSPEQRKTSANLRLSA